MKKLIEENDRNAELFGSSYHHEWDEYLIRYPDGRLVPPNRITEPFKRFLRKNGLKVARFHDLRHSCASILLAMGYDIVTIQEIMGHAHLSTTQMYLHPMLQKKDEALHRICNEVMEEEEPGKEKTESGGKNWWKNVSGMAG